MLVLFHFLRGLLQRRQTTDSLSEFRLALKQIGSVPCVSTKETAPKSGSMTPRCGNPLADRAIETHLPSRPHSTWHRQSKPADRWEGPVRSVGWECRRPILHFLLNLSKNHFLLQCWCEILQILCNVEVGEILSWDRAACCPNFPWNPDSLRSFWTMDANPTRGFSCLAWHHVHAQ